MSTINETVKKLAPDLTKDFPRSPHAMLGGYILAQRCVDKCRADLAGTVGDYHFDCPLDNFFLGFAGLKGADLKEFVATGAADEAVGKWIAEHATKRERIEIIKSWRITFRRTFRRKSSTTSATFSTSSTPRKSALRIKA
jgi:hypothetical protein